ncbi:serine hydrolase [Mesorhizobium sp.]|uniref:serine hydrolase domain-containing protein n=1 Tax=Mesorhizobium sp. TaxID=1871066 RepID=UPI000FE6F3C1|nr:serine hydrolase domain-containing protein [Mesorhizobium sp.]RWD84335.1 MAG: class A beta-lactamase-related serine hydrolase [Mesorhizobium sp.]
MIARTLGAVAIAVCATGSAMDASTPALKPIDPVALQTMAEGAAKELLLPGAMVLLQTPQGNFALGYGTTELGVTNPPRADTHFRPASNTKTMTAAVIVQLVQEGKLGFDDLISKYVQGVPNGDKITIRQLLKMRSGLYNFTNAPELAESLDHDPDKVWTTKEVLALAFDRPTHFEPGAQFEYNNTNYYLLGLVAEKIEGQPLASIFQDRLFGPLGMKNTALPVNTSNAIPEPYAHGYLYGGTSYALVDAPYPDDLQAAAKAGTLKPNDDTWQNPSPYFAAGAVVSTADDLATWIRALVGGKVLNADYQRQWLDSPEPEDPSKPEGQKYGYGISAITFGPNKVYFHGGEMPGYNSFMGHDPANDVTLIIWTNLTLSPDGKATANTLMVKILDQIYTVSPLQKAK